MYGQVILHGRLDPASKAAEVSFRLARKWQLAERRVAIIRSLEKARHQQWVRAESVKAYRRPTLLEDNPTSG
jgi:hypothetical protein